MNSNPHESPLATAYNRLDEVHRAIHSSLEGYHKIEDFRAGINTAIQALRNITFALQKQKDRLVDFENWYSAWQKRMSADPILKVLHDARTTIVHKEDLKLLSIAITRTKGWVDFEKTTFTFDPFQDTHSVAKGFYETFARHLKISDLEKSRLLFEFERKWVYDRLPDHELLEAIICAYNFFSEMLLDAQQKFSQPILKKDPPGEYCSGERNPNGELKCMIITTNERCLVFGFQDGRLLTAMTESVSIDMLDLKKAQDRYGDDWKSNQTTSLLEGLLPEQYPYDQMKPLIQMAISNLRKDKHLIPVTFVFHSEKEPPKIISHPFGNQEEKVATMDKLATHILKSGGNYVLTIAEVWQYTFEKDPFIPTEADTRNASEIITAACLSATEVKVISIPFKKNLFGQIKFQKPHVESTAADDSEYYIYHPLIVALKEASAHSRSNP